MKKSRNRNLRGIQDPGEYLNTIKADGYATSSAYVENNMRIIRQYRLTKYDAVKSGEEKTIAKIAETLIAQARSWIGCRESDGSHRKIIDIYNSHRPLARGYAVKYTDAWCAAFVEEVAREVIAGRWGNGEQRKRKLMEAGAFVVSGIMVN